MARHGFLVGLSAVVIACAAPISAPVPFSSISIAAYAAEDPGAFIMKLADRALGALTDPNLDDQVRAERFRDLVRDGLDVDFIASRVMGPYVRRATDAEMAEFRDLLEENIVRKYSVLFKGYSGEKIELIDTKPGSRDTSTVSIRVFPTDGTPPTTVRWVVHEVDGKNKIIDIIIERASMVTTQKEEFVSVIRRGGGKVEALLQELRERNAELAQGKAG